MTDQDLARRAVALLDLTDLSNGLDETGVERLCARAVTPLGPVVAVCLWAGFVPQARRLLRDTPVRVATVSPAWRARITSGTVDMPTASAPRVRSARISAGVSKLGPVTQA